MAYQHQEEAVHEPEEKPYNGPCFIIIRYAISRAQSCKNALTKWLSIHDNYTGSVSGVSQRVQGIEGGWEEDKGIAMLFFQNLSTAIRWNDSVPEIRQQDFLGGIDMVIVPVNDMPDPGHTFMQVLDLNFFDLEGFRQDYSDEAKDVLKKHNAREIVSSSESKKLKGLWNPGHLVINSWQTCDCFEKAYNSDENQKLKQRRESYASTRSCVFELEPLIPRRM